MPDIFVEQQNTQTGTAQGSGIGNNQPADPVSSPAPAIPVTTSDTSSVHLFTSYCENPDDITFQNQEDGEKVLLFIRKDFITNLPWLIAGFVFLFLPVVAAIVLSSIHISLPVGQNYIFVFVIFYYLLLVTFIFISFISWYFNLDLVTDRRIVDIDFEGIVYKNIAATKLTLVQDVSYQQAGVFRTIFDYGNVLVQTAGTIDNFTFESVPRPEDAVHVVENLIGKRNEQP